MDREPAPRARRWGLPLVVAATAVAFLVAVAPWATDPFGYSLDGFNGAMWGLGARAAADDPVASRLGGIQPDGDRYANHPPLTVWSAAVGSAVSGDRPAGVRAPAIVASVLALAVLALLLVDAGLSPAAAGAGVVVAGSTGMFLTYGAMLDTPVVSLPFGLAALAVAQRCRQGRPPPTALIVAAGALAALSGWQATLAASLAAGLVLLGPDRRRSGLTLAAGVTAGTAVTVSWIARVQGGLGRLFDQAGLRTGSSGSDAPWLEAMGQHLTDLFGPPPVLLALLVLIVVGLVRRTEARPLVVVLLATLVGYTLLFRNGAAVHDYWVYWGVALVGVAGAGGADAVMATAARRHRGAAATALVGALAVASLAAGQVHRTTAETRIRDGLDLVPVLEAVPEPADPSAVALAVYGAPGDLPWADHLVHGRAVEAADVDALRDLPPDLPVLVILRGVPSARLRAIETTGNERFALVPAAALADHLGG